MPNKIHIGTPYCLLLYFERPALGIVWCLQRNVAMNYDDSWKFSQPFLAAFSNDVRYLKVSADRERIVRVLSYVFCNPQCLYNYGYISRWIVSFYYPITWEDSFRFVSVRVVDKWIELAISKRKQLKRN